MLIYIISTAFWQEEFFKLFEYLHENNKQIVITSDRPASELDIMDRLKSRFSWGIPVDVRKPNFTLRKAILKKKLNFLISDPTVVSEEALDYIANYFDENVRELEGALRRFISYCVAFNIDYTLEAAEESLKSIISKDKQTNEDNNSKIKQLLKNNITPILCIGETKNERTNNETEIILKKDINDALKDIEKKEKVIIAYEPLWSIGTNEVLSPDEIEKVVLSIRKIIPNNRILYGGSVTEENIEKLNEVNLLDGYLLGKVSLYPKRVKKLLEKLV